MLDDLPRVQNSTRAPCWLQEQIAKQNSYVETIKRSVAEKTTIETVYHAPCKVDPTSTPKTPQRVASKG